MVGRPAACARANRIRRPSMVVNSVFMAKSDAPERRDRGSRADLTFQYSGVIARRLAALTRAIAPSGSLLIRCSLLIVHAREAGDSILLPIGNLFNGRP